MELIFKLKELSRESIAIDSLGVVSMIQGHTNFGTDFHIVEGMSIPVKIHKDEIFISMDYYRKTLNGS